MTHLLIVCTANICRSPVAEAALAGALSATGIVVTSAGTASRDGAPAAPESVEYVRSVLGIRLQHRSRALTPMIATGADLVLTLTQQQKTQVIREAPSVVRRTFTLLELAGITRELGPEDWFADLRSFAQGCARRRSRGGKGQIDLDVPDPYGGPPADYRRSFDLIRDAAEEVSRSIVDRVAILPAPLEDLDGPAPRTHRREP
ncbi:hypothetical protein [Brachybacterium phenoliresistens]|uniref:arsenate reductase/protein-tyrosine-phosphatase family protein n=1 Tax=Brachybacterium phenoliresistens TaxID=396014 RepID=UPI0031CEDAC0